MASTAPIVPKVAKTRPVELGCAAPQSLTLKGRIALSEPNSIRLRTFIEAYSQTCEDFWRLLRTMIDAGGDERVIAILAINPSSAPADIAGHPAWVESHPAKIKDDAGQIIGGTYSEWDSIDSVLYSAFRDLVDPEGHKITKGGQMLRALLAKHDLASRIMTKEALYAAMRRLSSEGGRRRAAMAVAGSLRSLVSLVAVAEEENDRRIQVKEELFKQRPLFFPLLVEFMDYERRWSAATRLVAEERRELSDTRKLPYKAINHYMRVALADPRIPAAWRLESAPDDGVTVPVKDVIPENPEIVEMLVLGLVAKIGSTNATPALDRDWLVRASGSLKELADWPFFVNRVTDLYIKSGGVPFTSNLEHENFFKSVPRIPGIKPVHLAWAKIVKNKAAHPLKQLFTDVADFCSACREVRTSKEGCEAPNFMPAWDSLLYKWEDSVREREGRALAGNESALRLTILEHYDGEGRHNDTSDIQAFYRGNNPLQAATKLPAQLDVFTPGTQFRPDRTVQVANSQRKSYLKAQAIKIRASESGFDAFISITSMTETLAPVREGKGVERVGVGQRVLVLHVAPGGQRLATATLHERTEGGWKDHLIRHEYSVTTRTPGFNRKVKDKAWVHLEGHAVDFKTMRARKQCVDKGESVDNEVQQAKAGEARTNFALQFMRNQAALVARLAVFNNAPHVLVALDASIGVGQANIRLPVRSFITLMQVGPRRVPSGCLATALAKAGLQVFYCSPAPSKITPAGNVGVPFREQVGGNVFFGEKEMLFDVNTRESVAFPRNAARNILRAWAEPEWAESIKEQIKKSDYRSLIDTARGLLT